MRTSCPHLSASCAYCLVAEGNPLTDWYHLVSSDWQRVPAEGESVIEWATSENEVAEEEWEDFVLEDLEV